MGDTKKEDRDFSLKKFIYSLFRPSIVKKIFYGYFSLALLIIIISAFTLSSLKKLNGLNGDIINIDAFVIETTESMIDNLFAQELFARRYLIMNSSDSKAEQGKILSDISVEMILCLSLHRSDIP